MPRTIKMFKNMGIFVPKKMFMNMCVKMPIGFTEKLKSVVVFLKIFTTLVLSRPFGREKNSNKVAQICHFFHNTTCYKL